MIFTVDQALSERPLVAILRGLQPDEAVAVGAELVAAGFLCLEVPLNSPQPFDSIRRLRDAFDGKAVIGAGTVLDRTSVGKVEAAGGQIVISPNTDPAVIKETKAAGLFSMPGFFTPSEAFTALAAGADILKLFPAETAGVGGLKAVRAVLPPSARIFAVGGTTPSNIDDWRKAGAAGLGIGSALYRSGKSFADIRADAEALVLGWAASKR